MNELSLTIVTPAGTLAPITCDSIHLTVCDDLSGKSGGSYGVRPGHTKALLALDVGTLTAFRGGEQILAGRSGCGFATVDGDAVTAVIEEFLEEAAK